MKKYLCLSLGLLMSVPILQCSSARVTTGVQVANWETIDKIAEADGSLALFPLGITSADEACIQPTVSDKTPYTIYTIPNSIAELSRFGEKDLKKLKVGEKPLAEFLATDLPYKDFDEAKADGWSFDKANTFKRGEIVIIEAGGSFAYGVICIKFQDWYIVQIASGRIGTEKIEEIGKKIDLTGKKITMASI